MRVRVNSLYRYNPCLLDQIAPCGRLGTLVKGQVVRVINLPSAPPANTMGQCYVADPATGKFLCMVSTSSLEPVVRRTHRLRVVNMAKAILEGVDAGDFSLTVARDAMDSIATCPESVRVVEA